MSFKVFFRGYRLNRTALLLLALSILGAILVPYAHAGTYIGYGSSNCSGSCGTTNWQNNYGNGKTIQAPFAGTLVAVGIFTATAGPSNIMILTTASAVTSTTYGCNTGQVCGTITDNAFSFTVQ